MNVRVHVCMCVSFPDLRSCRVVCTYVIYVMHTAAKHSLASGCAALPRAIAWRGSEGQSISGGHSLGGSSTRLCRSRGARLPTSPSLLCDALMRAADVQIEIEDAERYRYDGECLVAAEELGKPGLVEIRQKQDEFIFRVRAWGRVRVRTCVCV